MSRWIAHRQAYEPSLWRTLLVGSPAIVALTAAVIVTHASLWVSVPGGLIVGWVVPAIIWRRWKRKHPILPTAQWTALQAKRNGAPK